MDQNSSGASTSERHVFSATAWEIWHVYSTYVRANLSDMEDIARRLVSSRLARCARVSGGSCLLMGTDGAIHSLDVVANDEAEVSAGVDHASAADDAASSAETPPFDDYTLAAALAISAMEEGERRIFGGDPPVSYIRAALDECIFTDKSRTIGVYPFVKVYATGVILVQLRLIGPEQPTNVETLITEYVNAPLRDYEELMVPPKVADLAPFVGQLVHDLGLWSRARLAWARFGHRLVVEERSTAGEGANLRCPMPRHEGQRERFADLATIVADAVAYIASRPREGLRFILLGQPALLTTSNWSGRPHVHLLQFDGQADTASANERLHARALQAILARAARFVPSDPEAPKLRQFDDYAVYMNRAVRMWVYTPSVVADHDIVHEQQTIGEWLEYAYALHVRLLEEARTESADMEFLIRLKRLVAELPSHIEDHVHSGEIRDLLAWGLKTTGADNMRQVVSAITSARAELARYFADRQQSRWRTILSIIFGLVAAPRLATDVVEPLWRFATWPVPEDVNAAKLLFAVISLAFVGVLVTIGSYSVRSRDRL